MASGWLCMTDFSPGPYLMRSTRTRSFELDSVMPRINFHWVFGGWLGNSCSCHLSS
jgi:hypothetical protein